jgi:hypothetical protein
MPGKESEYSRKPVGKPEADIASQQNADKDQANNFDDINPENRDKAKKAYDKNAGSNKPKDQIRRNSDSGSKKPH